MNDNIEIIPITPEIKQKLNELRRNDYSDEELVRSIIEFAYFYRKSWFQYVTKFPQYDMESLSMIYVTSSTHWRLEKICDNSNKTVNDVIRSLICHYQSCYGSHRPRKEYVIRVSEKAKSKYFIHKPGNWTNDRFLLSLLRHLEKDKPSLEEFE